MSIFGALCKARAAFRLTKSIVQCLRTTFFNVNSIVYIRFSMFFVSLSVAAIYIACEYAFHTISPNQITSTLASHSDLPTINGHYDSHDSQQPKLGAYPQACAQTEESKLCKTPDDSQSGPRSLVEAVTSCSTDCAWILQRDGSYSPCSRNEDGKKAC
jgi:hypothetical protein